MKTKRFLLASSLLTLLLGFSACSSEGELLSGTPETPVPDDSNGIRIVVHTPAPDDIIMSRATHEAEEYKVNKLGVYLFLADAEGEDATYKLAAQKPALLPGGGDGQFTDNGDGTLSYTLPIDASWLGKSAKIALIANDEVTGLTESTTTLADFKKSIASNKLTEDDLSADIISGNIYAADASGATGLPMSAMANYSQKEAFTISPLGAELSASLQRIMARVDVCNYTPNLTITGIKVTHAAAQGYLFPQTTTAAPEESYFTMTPTGAYTEKLATDGIVYTDPEDNGDAKTANTHKHMFYLYEQVNAEGSSVEVVIDYKLEIGQTEKEGSVSVPLKSGDSYINTTRNNLYTIVVGNGKAIQDGIAVTTLTVNNWEETTNVEGELTPGSDDKDDGTEVSVGDFYLQDGTVVSPEDITGKESQVIGIVFQTFKDAPKRFGAAERAALKAKGVHIPHGLVMAVKLANSGTICQWKEDNTEEDGLEYMDNIQKSYADISGLSNYNQVNTNDAGYTNHPAFKAVADFAKISETQAPESSTGWFLPSVGQWWDFVENLGGFKDTMDDYRTSTSAIIRFYYVSNTNTSENIYMGTIETAQTKINKYLAPLGEDNYDKFVDNTYYWTSSEYSSAGARSVAFTSNHLSMYFYGKTDNYYVRAVLAF